MQDYLNAKVFTLARLSSSTAFLPDEMNVLFPSEKQLLAAQCQDGGVDRSPHLVNCWDWELLHMIFSNRDVLVELRQVRMRQIPWVKKAATFSQLRSLNLVTAARQRAAFGSGRPDVEIAALSEPGKSEFERLRRREECDDWTAYGRAPYVGPGADS